MGEKMPKKIVNQNVLDMAQEKFEKIMNALKEGKVVIIGNKKVKNITRLNTKSSYIFEIEFENGSKRSLYLSEFIRISVVMQE
jgi:S-adenosylmethionine:tRNA-ribosyltransferase-isomerase (queuine synthetase)